MWFWGSCWVDLLMTVSSTPTVWPTNNNKIAADQKYAGADVGAYMQDPQHSYKCLEYELEVNFLG